MLLYEFRDWQDRPTFRVMCGLNEEGVMIGLERAQQWAWNHPQEKCVVTRIR